jgi:cell division septation protein DedD
MAEQIMRTGGRELWLTRGHLAALGTSTVLIAVLAFMLGFKVGVRSAVATPAVTEAPSLLPAAGDRDSLEALLREVEQAQRARASAQANADQLTFPTALRASDASMTLGVSPVDASQVAVVPPDADATAAPIPATDFAPPTSGWAIQVAAYPNAEEADGQVATLREAGTHAYRVAALINAENWFRVRVGGYATKQDALDARAAVAAAVGTEDLMIVEAP